MFDVSFEVEIEVKGLVRVIKEASGLPSVE